MSHQFPLKTNFSLSQTCRLNRQETQVGLFALTKWPLPACFMCGSYSLLRQYFNVCKSVFDLWYQFKEEVLNFTTIDILD